MAYRAGTRGLLSIELQFQERGKSTKDRRSDGEDVDKQDDEAQKRL